LRGGVIWCIICLHLPYRLQVGDCCHSLSSSFSSLAGSGGPKIFFFPSSCVGGSGCVKMALTMLAFSLFSPGHPLSVVELEEVE
jgi:hypothetical protein